MIEKGREILQKAMTHVHLPTHRDADDSDEPPPVAREKTTGED